jgi:parallel beta-helix repeat protein
VIEGNTFRNWTKGGVSIRNGGFNQILGNTFSGSGGGIIVRGDGNEIRDNTHENNHSTDVDLRPLVIENGNTPVDENFGSDDQPHGDMITDTGKYAQVKNNTIDGNTYRNCRGVCVVWGEESRDLHPINNTFTNNNLIADEVNSTFLQFLSAGSEDDRKTNNFEDNELAGKHAQFGDLRQTVLIGSEENPETK